MNKTYTMVCTHLGADYELLIEILNKNPRVAAIKTNFSYLSVSDLPSLYTKCVEDRKSNEYKTTFCDFLTYNHNLGCKYYYDICKFIFLVRKPEATLNLIDEYDLEMAVDYYCFRLQRIYHIHQKTGGLFVTWDGMTSGRALPSIENYLGLKMPLIAKQENFSTSHLNKIPDKMIRRCEKAYDKYVGELVDRINEN